MKTDEQLNRIIQLLERLVQQSEPPSDLLRMEYTRAMKEAVAVGDKGRVKALAKAYNERRAS